MPRLRSIFIRIILMLMLSASFTIKATAYTADEHDKIMLNVLFGKGYSKNQSNEINKYINELTEASYFTIDEFNQGEVLGRSTEIRYKKDLKDFKISGWPNKFNEIDYIISLDDGETHISANSHHKYTHQGWDIEFGSSKANAFWSKRKSILLSTVNDILGFNKLPFRDYNIKVRCISGIIYYVHILGDYEAADKYTKIVSLVPLADLNRGKNTSTAGIIDGLEIYTKTLFEKDQSSSPKYKALMKSYTDLRAKAVKLQSTYGGINTQEEFDQYHQIAVDLLTALTDNMPDLFRELDYFKSKFYVNPD